MTLEWCREAKPEFAFGATAACCARPIRRPMPVATAREPTAREPNTRNHQANLPCSPSQPALVPPKHRQSLASRARHRTPHRATAKSSPASADSPSLRDLGNAITSPRRSSVAAPPSDSRLQRQASPGTKPKIRWGPVRGPAQMYPVPFHLPSAAPRPTARRRLLQACRGRCCQCALAQLSIA